MKRDLHQRLFFLPRVGERYASAIRSIAFLFVGSVGAAVLSFLTQVVLARSLEPAALGTFVAALTLVTMLSPLASMGVPSHLLRVFGREGWGAIRWIPASLKLAATTTGWLVAGLLGWALLGPHETGTRYLLAILSVCVLGQISIDLTSTKYQLEGRFSDVALWQILPGLMRFAAVCILWLICSKTSIEAIAIAYAGIALALLAAGFFNLRLVRGGRLRLEGHAQQPLRDDAADAPPKLKVLQGSWAFAVGSVLYLAYSQGPIVLIEHLVGPYDAGILSVAYLILAAATLLPSVVYQKYLLPKVLRWEAHEPTRMRSTFRKGARLMLLLGSATAVIVWAVAPWGISALFGPSFQDSVGPACWLALVIPIRFLTSNVGGSMNNEALQRRKILAMGMAVSLNVILMVTLVRHWGAASAVFSTIATELALLGMLVGMRRLSSESNDQPASATVRHTES